MNLQIRRAVADTMHSPGLNLLQNTLSMPTIHYIVEYDLSWNDGTMSSGRLNFQGKDLRKIFSRLYRLIVLASISDEELYNPGMINEVNIRIKKSQKSEVESEVKNKNHY